MLLIERQKLCIIEVGLKKSNGGETGITVPRFPRHFASYVGNSRFALEPLGSHPHCIDKSCVLLKLV